MLRRRELVRLPRYLLIVILSTTQSTNGWVPKAVFNNKWQLCTGWSQCRTIDHLRYRPLVLRSDTAAQPKANDPSHIGQRTPRHVCQWWPGRKPEHGAASW